MKKLNVLTRMLLLVALLVGSVGSVWADDVIYSETFGTTGNKTDVSSYSGFSSTLITPTSSGWKISDTTTSTCNITGTSGSCNAYCGSASDLIFNFGDKLSNYTNVKLSFNYNKGSGNGKANTLKLYISSNGGTTYGSDLLPSNTGASNTWYSVTDITIPAAALSNLCIKFSTSTNTNRLDDIKITGVEDVPAYNINAQSNNNELGTVSLLGSIITGSPKSGCRYASPAYTVTEGSATVAQVGNEFTVTPTSNCTVTINFEAIPTHNVTWNVNGETTVESYKEGDDVEFPSNPSTRAGKVFKGWSSEAIDGTTDTAPTFVTEATMSTTDLNYYAVFASEVTTEGNVSLTIDTSTENFPDSYGSANTFEKCNLEGVNFQIQQAFVNTSTNRLQWRASGHESGTGTMYNDDALNKIQSIVLNYDADNNKNFTIKVGDDKNPSSGTTITPYISDNVYTFDCSTYNKSYFVMTNGTGAGYLSSIVINYIGETTIIKQYCTTIPATVPVTISDAKYATFSSPYRLDFEGSDVKAYKAISTGDASVTLEEMTVVDANVGVLLHAETANTYNIPTTSAAATSASDNLLVSTAFASYTVTGEETGTAYVFGKLNEEVGFFKAATGKTIGVGKSWLLVPGTGAKDVEFLSFIFGDEESETTSISEELRVKSEESAAYNLAGQKVGNSYKGIVIVNGKKYLRK